MPTLTKGFGKMKTEIILYIDHKFRIFSASIDISSMKIKELEFEILIISPKKKGACHKLSI